MFSHRAECCSIQTDRRTNGDDIERTVKQTCQHSPTTQGDHALIGSQLKSLGGMALVNVAEGGAIWGWVDNGSSGEDPHTQTPGWAREGVGLLPRGA